MPVRIQLRRTRGWRMPPGAVKVDRTTRHGNQFCIVSTEDGLFHITRYPERVRFGHADEDATTATSLSAARAEAVRRYREWLHSDWGRHHRLQKIEELRGKDLACWCPLSGPCHADVLLELVNPDD